MDGSDFLGFLYILLRVGDKWIARKAFPRLRRIGNNMAIAIEDPTSQSFPPASLAEKTSGAFLWMVSQAIGSKLITALAQIVLAWKLDRKDFGLVGLAYTVSGFAGILQRSGLEDILIQRQKNIRRWATSAFWLALLSGCLAALAMLVAAPIAARFFKAPQLVTLICIIAISSPITALSIIPSAMLQIGFRFRAFSKINFVTSTLTSALSILFAWLGFGVYSFVLPQPISALVARSRYGRWPSPGISPHLQVRRWRYLMGDSAFLLGTAVCNAVMGNGDYLVLGILQPKEVVGSYFFAFNLSTQTIATLTTNLAAAVFPALSSLKEESGRLKAAYIARVGQSIHWAPRRACCRRCCGTVVATSIWPKVDLGNSKLENIEHWDGVFGFGRRAVEHDSGAGPIQVVFSVVSRHDIRFSRVCHDWRSFGRCRGRCNRRFLILRGVWSRRLLYFHKAAGWPRA